MKKIEFVVPRISHQEMTIAIVRATVTKPELTSLTAFRDQLVEALTQWGNQTKSGKQAWESSEYNFNVGDLSVWQDHPALIEALAFAGIIDLRVAIHNLWDSPWAFDQVLVRKTPAEKKG